MQASKVIWLTICCLWSQRCYCQKDNE